MGRDLDAIFFGASDSPSSSRPEAHRGAPHTITGAQTLDARFPGQWFQLEAGLHYNWHRHYDASLGRYTQPDPLGFVDGPSVYAYARNAPAIYVDRDGRIVWWVPVLIAAGIGAAVDIGYNLWTNDGDLTDLSATEVAKSAAISAALTGLAGPSGAIFGRLRYCKMPSLLNSGNFRIGWSWNQNGRFGARNYFGVHGGTPRSPSHWHRTPIPGPKDGGPGQW